MDLRQRRSGERGVTSVELVIVTPVLLLLILAVDRVVESPVERFTTGGAP